MRRSTAASSTPLPVPACRPLRTDQLQCREGGHRWSDADAQSRTGVDGCNRQCHSPGGRTRMSATMAGAGHPSNPTSVPRKSSIPRIRLWGRRSSRGLRARKPGTSAARSSRPSARTSSGSRAGHRSAWCPTVESVGMPTSSVASWVSTCSVRAPRVYVWAGSRRVIDTASARGRLAGHPVPDAGTSRALRRGHRGSSGCA